jgi:hypothetical protein
MQKLVVLLAAAILTSACGAPDTVAPAEEAANPALMEYCVQQSRALYERRPDIGAGKDPVARCKEMITRGGAATTTGRLVDRAGVDAEIAYTEQWYNAASADTATDGTTRTTVAKGVVLTTSPAPVATRPMPTVTVTTAAPTTTTTEPPFRPLLPPRHSKAGAIRRRRTSRSQAVSRPSP